MYGQREKDCEFATGVDIILRSIKDDRPAVGCTDAVTDKESDNIEGLWRAYSQQTNQILVLLYEANGCFK